MRTLPSREVVESFTFPEQSTNAPRGDCPSTNRIAPPGYVLRWLAALKDFNTSGESPQNQFFRRNLQLRQFSLARRVRTLIEGFGFRPIFVTRIRHCAVASSSSTSPKAFHLRATARHSPHFFYKLEFWSNLESQMPVNSRRDLVPGNTLRK